MDNVRPLHKPAVGRAPVIALHCSGSNGTQWEPYRALMPAGVPLHAPHLLGYDSPARWTNGSPVTLQTEAQRVHPLMDSAGQPVHLVGHSYGGAVALQAAVLWPEQVLSLTLYEPVLFHVLFDDAASAGHAASVTSVGRRVSLLSMSGQQEDAAELFVSYWSGHAAWARMSPERRDAIKIRMPKVRAEFEALFHARFDVAQLAETGIPVRLVHGTTSPAPAQRVTELIAQRLPAAEVTTIEGMAHMAPITHRQWVAPHLLRGIAGFELAEAA